MSVTPSTSGITLGQADGCSLDASRTTAHCITISGSGGSPLVRSSAATTLPGATFSREIAFTIPRNQPGTTVHVEVSLPKGFAASGNSSQLGTDFSYDPKPASLAMGALKPLLASNADDPSSAAAIPGADGLYRFAGHVSGIPDSLSEVEFELNGEATFEPSAGCHVPTGSSGHLLVCNSATPQLSPEFVLKMTDGIVPPTAVSLTLLTPYGYYDTTGTNDNFAPAQLDPAPAPKTADVSVADLGPANAPANADGTYTLTARASGFPAGSPDAIYTLNGNASFVEALPGDACQVVSKVLVCANPGNGPVTFRVRAGDNLKDTSNVTLQLAPLNGYDDPDPSNNSTNPVTLRAVPNADVTVDVPERAHEDGNDPTANTYAFDATVSGIPADVRSVTLSLPAGTGAEWKKSEGCQPAGETLTCDVKPPASANGTPTFSADVAVVLGYTGTVDLPAEVTVEPPAHYVDRTPDKPASDVVVLGPEPTDALSVKNLALSLNSQNDGTLSLAVSGAATKRGLTLTVRDKDGHETGLKFLSNQSQCQFVDDHTVTCAAGTTDVKVEVTAPAGLVEGTLVVDDGVHDRAEADFTRLQQGPHANEFASRRTTSVGSPALR